MKRLSAILIVALIVLAGFGLAAARKARADVTVIGAGAGGQSTHGTSVSSQSMSISASSSLLIAFVGFEMNQGPPTTVVDGAATLVCSGIPGNRVNSTTIGGSKPAVGMILCYLLNPFSISSSAVITATWAGLGACTPACMQTVTVMQFSGTNIASPVRVLGNITDKGVASYFDYYNSPFVSMGELAVYGLVCSSWSPGDCYPQNATGAISGPGLALSGNYIGHWCQSPDGIECLAMGYNSGGGPVTFTTNTAGTKAAWALLGVELLLPPISLIVNGIDIIGIGILVIFFSVLCAGVWGASKVKHWRGG